VGFGYEVLKRKNRAPYVRHEGKRSGETVMMDEESMMTSRVKGRALGCFMALVIALSSTVGFVPQAYAAEDDDVGETQMCVQLRQIDASRIIDDKTIVLRMLGRTPYVRIDLAHDCPGLVMADNFMSATSISQLCKQDIVRVVQEPIGSQCIIDRIVAIDEVEAKALLASRKR